MCELRIVFEQHRPGEGFAANIPKSCHERMFAATDNALHALYFESFRGCGRSTTNIPYRITRIRPATHLVLYTEAGEGWLECAGRTFRLLPGSVMVLPTGVRHDYGAAGRWDILWFHVFPAPHWNGLFPREPVVFDASYRERLGNIGEEFLLELNRKNCPDNLDLLHEFTKVLRMLIRRELTGVAPADWLTGPRERLEKLWKLVQNEPSTTWSIASLAEHAGVSRSHLHLLMKKYYGMSAMEKVARLRMDRATQMLHDPNAKVASIAYELGYDSPYSFSRAFKRIVGVSPLQYRMNRGVLVPE